jgi:hypothetical protein
LVDCGGLEFNFEDVVPGRQAMPFMILLFTSLTSACSPVSASAMIQLLVPGHRLMKEAMQTFRGLNVHPIDRALATKSRRSKAYMWRRGIALSLYIVGYVRMCCIVLKIWQLDDCSCRPS